MSMPLSRFDMTLHRGEGWARRAMFLRDDQFAHPTRPGPANVDYGVLKAVITLIDSGAERL